jgi:TRAP-type C4-dicarboxylate transport system substrate-binding protein
MIRKNNLLGWGWVARIVGITLLSTMVLAQTVSAANQITWKAAVVTGRGDWACEVYVKFAEEVAKRTNGRFKIDVYPGATIGFKTTTYIDAVNAGLTEMTQTWGDYLTGTDSLMGIGAFIPTSYPLRVKVAFPALYEELSVYIEKKYPSVKVFHVGQMEPRQLHTRKKLSSLGELKGVKIRSAGAIDNKVYAKLGAVPTVLSYEEMYTGFEQGVIDAGSNSIAGMLVLKLYEVAPYLYDEVWYGGGLHLGIFNKKSFDSLPSDIRSIVWEIARNNFPKWWDDELGKSLQNVRGELVKRGMKVVQWPKDDLDKYKGAVDAIRVEWLASLNPEQKKHQEKVWKAIEGYKAK